MSVAFDSPMTLAEFLTWEERQPLRWEFDGQHPIAMAGGTRAHAQIQRNLAISIGGRRRGGPCQFIGSDLKVQTASDKIRYPDGFVVCTPAAGGSTIVHDPVVIFEVPSEGTSTRDFGEKNEEYAALPSVQRYVILFQSRIGGTMFERAGDDWIGHLLTGDKTIEMPEIGIAVPLAELYVDVDLSGLDESSA
jgi:Uma2 family endonuclease